jgi:hypothetical protein
MYHKVLSLIPVLFLIITNQLISQNNFYAYHTKVSFMRIIQKSHTRQLIISVSMPI